MKKLQLIGITVVMLCSLFFAMVLTPSVFAQIVVQNQPIEDLDDVLVVASVSIDRYEYDPAGEGVVYLDGSFDVMNYHAHRGCEYTFEVRLELFKLDKKTGEWKTVTPDAKTNPLIRGV